MKNGKFRPVSWLCVVSLYHQNDTRRHHSRPTHRPSTTTTDVCTLSLHSPSTLVRPRCKSNNVALPRQQKSPPQNLFQRQRPPKRPLPRLQYVLQFPATLRQSKNLRAHGTQWYFVPQRNISNQPQPCRFHFGLTISPFQNMYFAPILCHCGTSPKPTWSETLDSISDRNRITQKNSHHFLLIPPSSTVSWPSSLHLARSHLNIAVLLNPFLHVNPNTHFRPDLTLLTPLSLLIPIEAPQCHHCECRPQVSRWLCPIPREARYP